MTTMRERARAIVRAIEDAAVRLDMAEADCVALDVIESALAAVERETRADERAKTKEEIAFLLDNFNHKEAATCIRALAPAEGDLECKHRRHLGDDCDACEAAAREGE